MMIRLADLAETWRWRDSEHVFYKGDYCECSADITAALDALRAEIEQRRANILTHPNEVYRVGYVDALSTVLALLTPSAKERT